MKKTIRVTDPIMQYDCNRASFFHEMRLAEKEKRRKRMREKIRKRIEGGLKWT